MTDDLRTWIAAQPDAEELSDAQATLVSGCGCAFCQPVRVLLAKLRAERSTPCPHVRSSDDGTSYCTLAERSKGTTGEPYKWYCERCDYRYTSDVDAAAVFCPNDERELRRIPPRSSSESQPTRPTRPSVEPIVMPEHFTCPTHGTTAPIISGQPAIRIGCCPLATFHPSYALFAPPQEAGL